MNDNQDLPEHDESAIAIIGMACHLPGALNIKEYWENLRDGVESVQFFTDEELLAAGESARNLAHPNYVRAQPTLENFNRFDASFWGFSPQDAAVTDPAHRLFLEVAYEALEHAGQTAYDSEGRVGVFASSGENLYRMQNLQSNPQLIDDMGAFLVRHTGNCMNFLATRLSYELDLRGPSINVQTACSSTLVGIHMATQSLLGGECDTAIVGGSTVVVPQKRGYIYRDGEILSPDGHCRPFDANSQGTVFGSGAGAVVLKRLEDAITDGDTVHAVIRGTAVNNDGAQKIGFLAPSVDGQAGAISEALTMSGIDAGDVSYIETHGTGTPVGDPIEFEAINQVFREATDKRDYCRIGSVKSNIGHLGEAAGSAALIKVILSLKNKQIPASLNYLAPNPQLDMHDTPFMINSTLTPWKVDGTRTAGINALGAGGTNAYILVDEAPDLEPSDDSDHALQLLVLSAKTATALNSASRNLAKALKENTELNFADVAHTLQVGRRAYTHRRALACETKEDAIALLEISDPKRLVDAECSDQSPSLVFMFPGGGAQYSGMGQDLYATEETYREAFDSCMNCLSSELATQVKSLVFAKDEDQKKATKELERPSLTLTSLFATEYSLAKQLLAWGAKPSALIGHSMGENTAACIAGVMRLEDAMKLVLIRGQLFEKSPEGGMLSISLPIEEARQYMPADMDTAAINAPDLCVASGAVTDIDALQSTLESKDIGCHRVRIEVAAHSRILECILDDFRAYLSSITLSPPKIPFTSNLTGSWITDEQATDPNYWVDHLRNTVRFADNVETVLKDEPRVLVEIGPGRILTNLARAGATPAKAIFNSMRHPNEPDSDCEFALRTLGNIWANGVAIDWEQYRGDEMRHRIPLPTYPFERKIYWVEPGKQTSLTTPEQEDLSKRNSIDEWFASVNWHQNGQPVLKASVDHNWLIFKDDLGVSDALIKQLASNTELDKPQSITEVTMGASFSQSADDHFELDPNCNEHFEHLFSALDDLKNTPDHIVYLWPASSTPNALSSQLAPCFWGLFNLGKMLGELDDPISLTVVSTDMHAIGGQASHPEKSLLIGPVAVLPHEFGHVTTKSIDIHLSNSQAGSTSRIVEQISRELLSEATDRFVAYRGNDRLTRKVEAARLDPTEKLNASWLKKDSTVLITGGLGGIALNIAKQLAQQGVKNLVLVSRRGLPNKAEWPTFIEANPNNSISNKIRYVQEVESLGTQVIAAKADITDPSAMQKVIEDVSNQYGQINGIIHSAGSMDDQLIVLKTRESAEAVINAKVRGAIVLDALFEDKPLDFFVVFSSIASFLGLPGQVDYTAANAFLDAFARERAERASGKTISINWNAWAQVGMAAESLIDKQALTGKNNASELPLEHPLLDVYHKISDAEHLFTTQFSLDKHWLLSEHKTKQGAYLIPGTGYIELLRAAFSEHMALEKLPENSAIELNDIQFLSAFQVAENQNRSLHIRAEETPDETVFTIFAESEEIPVATGSARIVSGVNHQPIALPEVRSRCEQSVNTAGQFLDQTFMDFGPRWGCINSIHFTDKEALIDLQVPEEFVGDLAQYQVHPAVLDMATGGAQFLLDDFSADKDFYIPVAYQKVRILGAMPSKMVSHIRRNDIAIPGFASFDVMVMNEDGTLFLQIYGFTMKKVSMDFSAQHQHTNQETSQETGLENTSDDQQAKQTDHSPDKQASNSLAEILKQGILPTEGLDAFNRVMAQQHINAQTIISSVDSALWLKQLDASLQDKTPGNEKTTSYEQEEVHDPDVDHDIPEIEALITCHAAVESAVVRSHLDESGQRRLIAHFIRDDWESITVTELRQYVKDNLDAKLVPQQLVELDEFPLNAEGEIDRTQLLDPFAPIDTYIAPRSGTEKKLAKIWQNAVGVNRVSLTDNFFDIGGHSLVSIRVIVKVKKELGVRVDQGNMVLLTLEQMAKEIDDKLKITGSMPRVSTTTNSQSTTDTASDNKTATLKSENKTNKKGMLKSLFGRKKS
ncbi:MAG: acyl transferase domain-containing protein/acyl carrier protein [Pseudohongiellaceae bacterium]|jgi:acyl transferase domain-containing protein/acyl carrier protein